MLLLSRKTGEKIIVGENVVITVVDIDRGKIRLGLEAPKDVSVMRLELLPEDRQKVILEAAGVRDVAGS